MTKTKKVAKKIKTAEKKIVKAVAATKNLPSIQIPMIGVIVFCLLLAATSFTAGFSYFQFKNAGKTTTQATATFDPEKTEKPELDFYVMSFCPYGNQMEEVLKPVADLLGDSVTLQPRYIFEKISDLKTQCQQYDSSNCTNYVTAGYFSTESECKSALVEYSNDCYDENNYLKIGDAYYSSLHGRSEAIQDVREICAYNSLGDDKTNWWKFVENVNNNCTVDDVDTCWEEQAKSAGLDTNQITECFNTQAAELIDKEIALTTENNIQGSPTLYIGDSEFPAEDAYTSAGTGGMKIGKKVFAESEYRTSEFIKEALCAAFKKSPRACKTSLEVEDDADTTASAASAGSCD